ncbi:hypothetical protein ALO92_101706 [Pseudomonas congelans]|uniref:Uncharacterized protein n=1 Tax=Pseudomonas congelans TaxID=200452 RepID=A0A0P9MDM2_9PSED|nr:hypothetical protein ALO92_101706 [Pseudomonas congelans]
MLIVILVAYRANAPRWHAVLDALRPLFRRLEQQAREQVS